MNQLNEQMIWIPMTLNDNKGVIQDCLHLYISNSHSVSEDGPTIYKVKETNQFLCDTVINNE